MNQVPVKEHLENIRSKLGEDAFRSEVRRLVREAIPVSPKHEAFWQDLTKDYDWLDWEEEKQKALEAATAAGPKPNPVVEAVRQQMPALKTQAQFNALMAAFDALRLTLNSIFEGDKEKSAEGRKALDAAIDLAGKVTEITQKLADVPEAATSQAAQEFKQPPAQYQEYEYQRQLLGELGKIESLDELNKWYADTKPQRDRILSQSFRNALMDAIRARKLALEPPP